MYVRTFRITFQKAAIASAAAALLLFSLLCTVILQKEEPVLPQDTNALCTAWLQRRGIETDPERAVVREVTVPAHFDGICEKYNALQLQQGFDLRHWAGMKAMMYSFPVTNATNYHGNIRANLLTCDENVIGFDLCDLTTGEYFRNLSDFTEE